MADHSGLPTPPAGLHLGIRGKIAAILFATLLLSLTVTSLLALHNQQQDTYAEADRRGREAAHFIAQYLAYNVVSYDYHTLELLLQDLTHRRDIVYARVDNNRGNTMAVAGALPSDRADVRTFGADVRLGGELLGRLTLSLSTEQTTHLLAMRQRELLLGQMLAMVVVLAAGFLALSFLIVRPLTVITHTLRHNARADRTRIENIPLQSADEFGEMARGFNAMGHRLNEARQKLESRIDAADQELQDAYRQLELQTQELREKNRELEQRSLTDPLTGLHNRRYFEMVMETEVERCIRHDETVSILLIDVNGLPALIERVGHHGGDELIRGVGHTIGDHTRPADVACRYGGGEFFMLCRRATIANAVAIADDLQRILAEQSFMVRGRHEHVTVSIGVATIPGVHRVADAAALFQCADEALRYSHQHNRPVVHYSMLERTARPVAL
jgi:diguanylate cyclase (GGDEF)-like protein